MKKYFNCGDLIIIVFLFLSIAWIIGYKFYWLNMIPLFSKADKVADITYTISTSIVASAIFYLFTIFIPKISEVNRMKKQIKIDIYSLEQTSFTIIQFINKYSIDQFIQNVFSDNGDIERDFTKYYGISQHKPVLLDSMKRQIDILESILKNYSDLLSNEIKRKIVNITKQGKGSLIEKPIVPIPDNYSILHKLHFETFKEILNITNLLKDVYI